VALAHPAMREFQQYWFWLPVSASSILMYVLGTLEYNAYLIIDKQAFKERDDDLDSNGLLSFDIGGVLVISVERI
jgi:hypothetical protein